MRDGVTCLISRPVYTAFYRVPAADFPKAFLFVESWTLLFKFRLWKEQLRFACKCAGVILCFLISVLPTADSALAVVVYVKVKPGTEASFIEASLNNAKNSVQEEGIARFDFIQVSSWEMSKFAPTANAAQD